MTEGLIVLGIGIFLTLLIMLSRKITNKSFGIIMKVLGVLFFAVYFYRLFQYDAINSIVGFDGFLTKGQVIGMNFLRWLTMAGVILVTLIPFLKVKTLENIIALIIPFVVVLNIIFYRLNMECIIGPGYSLGNAVAITFAIELAIMGAVSGYFLYKKIINRDFKNILLELKFIAICFPLIMLMVFPLNMLQNFFGFAGTTAQDFELGHRIYLYIAFLTPLLITFFAKNKSYEIRRSIVCLFALSGFTQYFYTFTFNTGVTGLPFHLCNTAILLMVVAFLFKSKPVFYFTYLVNVIGSLFAIVLPNCSTDILAVNSFHFWFNHWYAFFVPLLGVTLKLFDRPNFKLVRGAIYIFSGYWLFAIILNAWLSNYDAGVDYFFLNKNFIVGKFNFLFPVKENFILNFNISGLNFNIYWLYDLIIFAAYVVMIFLVWIVYAYCYKVVDHYKEVKQFNDMDMLEMRKLKKEMKGRKITEPLSVEGKDMIQIKHFSKRYGSSKVFAVKDFNLEVHDGEVFGFLGHNGSGKSTTIKSLVGIQSITEGQMLICGYDISRQPLQAKMQIGYVSDNHAVYEHLTGREYVNYIADLYNVPKNARDERIEKYVKMFDLVDAFDREIKGYSHGMKQKVMVISSLIHEPKVWVLDEPLTGLDPTSSFQIKECMREHANKGNIVFFSSHVIEVVEKICDKIAIIAKGELKGIYDLKELKSKNISLEELYMSFAQSSQKKEETKEDENNQTDNKTENKVEETTENIKKAKKTAKTKEKTIKKGANDVSEA